MNTSNYNLSNDFNLTFIHGNINIIGDNKTNSTLPGAATKPQELMVIILILSVSVLVAAVIVLVLITMIRKASVNPVDPKQEVDQNGNSVVTQSLNPANRSSSFNSLAFEMYDDNSMCKCSYDDDDTD